MLRPVNLKWRDLPLDRVLRAANPKVAEPLEKVLAGVDLALEEGLILAKARTSWRSLGLPTRSAGAWSGTVSPTW
jgi:hypothetical protein